MKQICLSIPTGDQVAQDAKKVSLHNFFLSFTVGGFTFHGNSPYGGFCFHL